MEKFCSRFRFPENRRLTKESFGMVDKRLVAAGMGVTFLPRSYLTLYSEVDGLVCHPLDDNLNGSWKLANSNNKAEIYNNIDKKQLEIRRENAILY